VASCFVALRRDESWSDLVRDEEVVGSNPATPTVKYQVRGLIRIAGRAPEWLLAVLASAGYAGSRCRPSVWYGAC
jgi:hypothetical protein